MLALGSNFASRWGDAGVWMMATACSRRLTCVCACVFRASSRVCEGSSSFHKAQGAIREPPLLQLLLLFNRVCLVREAHCDEHKG